MKTRSDFVSNSSSCSFVLEDRAGEALDALLEAVKDVELEWGLLDDMSAILTVRGKDGEDALKGEFEKAGLAADDFSFEQDYYEADDRVVRLTARQLVDAKFGPGALKSVRRAKFEVDDCSNETLELYFMYAFFVRAGFAPDKSDSENDFETRVEFAKALSRPFSEDMAKKYEIEKQIEENQDEIQDKDGQ